MDSPTEDAAAVGDAKLKAGVAKSCVTAGGVNPEGVDACSVANKSGVDVDPPGMLHPASRMIRIVIRDFLFNRFKIKLLAAQNLCSEASAIGAVNRVVSGMIFFEA